MLKKYRVLPIEGSEGIEKLSDPPVGRRIYRPGDEIELDDAVNDVAGLKARGQIADIVPVKTEKAIPPGKDEE